MSLKLPKYTFLDEEVTKEMLKDFKGERNGWVLVGDKKWLFPSRYQEQGEGFYKFKPRSSDVWVLSYPRSGIYFNIILLTILFGTKKIKF